MSPVRVTFFRMVSPDHGRAPRFSSRSANFTDMIGGAAGLWRSSTRRFFSLMP